MDRNINLKILNLVNEYNNKNFSINICFLLIFNNENPLKFFITFNNQYNLIKLPHENSFNKISLNLKLKNLITKYWFKTN